MTLREEFEDDVETFLRTHAMDIQATSWTDQSALANFGAFAGAGVGDRRASLVAPQGYVRFVEHEAKVEDPIVKCSVPLVNVQLSDDANDLPVYVVPYMASTSMGVKLPAGPGKAFCITTRIDGCTFTLGGSAAEPYAFHSNVGDVDGGIGPKGDAIRAHVMAMENQFRAAEGLAADEGNFAQNRTHFNYWAQDIAARPASYVNYAQYAQQRVRVAIDNGERIYRTNEWFGHRKYRVRLDDYYRDQVMAANFIPFNAVVGVREGGAWTFYANTAAFMRFNVLEQSKVRGTVKNENNRNVSTNVIMTSGKIWPDIDMQARPFYAQVYDE